MAGASSHFQGSDGPGGLRLRAAQVYGFKPFGLEEADFIGASAAFTLRRCLDLRFSYHMLSVLSYREQAYLFSCLWRSGLLRFEPTVRFGTIRLEQSLIDWTVLLDFVFHARPVPELKVFFGTRNPLAVGLIRSGEKCPTEITTGFGYLVRRGLAFGVEIRKEGGFPTSVATGTEVRLAKGVMLRTGLRNAPKELCLGLGLRWGRIAFDVSSRLHLDLGITHEAGLTYTRG
jgi:hypothetical protein